MCVNVEKKNLRNVSNACVGVRAVFTIRSSFIRWKMLKSKKQNKSVLFKLFFNIHLRELNSFCMPKK